MKICVFTSTRAEYGLLSRLISRIDTDQYFELQLVVSGTHLSYEHGYTLVDILADGFEPTIKIANLIADDSSSAVINSSAILMQTLGVYFEKESPDCLIVLGDRVELLAACNAAVVAKIPIVHIHGGEITEGAVDEKIRHSVTKLSNLHFTSTAVYRQRVIQMGEQPDMVINCGALGLETITKGEISSRGELSEFFDVDFKENYFLIVYHPETNKDSEDITVLLSVLDNYPHYKKVIIYPNSDVMSRGIINSIERYKADNEEDVLLVKSASRRHYLGLMKYCCLYLGNSSSGIIEMPSFYRPIINIGDRQRGRISSASTLDSRLSVKELIAAIEEGLSETFQRKLPAMHNPYQGAVPSKKIIEALKELLPTLTSSKVFFDIEFKL